MFYLIKEWKIYGSSELPLKQDWYECIEKDFTQEELEKIKNWYLYIDWEFIESDESKVNESMKIQNKMRELNSMRRDLQDLVDFELATDQDKVQLAEIMTELWELAIQRKELK